MNRMTTWRLGAGVVALAGILLAICRSASAQPAPNPGAVQSVLAGRIRVAHAAWWGFNPDDATAILQAAINSRCPQLILDNMGQPWKVQALNLVSNQEIDFAPGVKVVAKPGAFQIGGSLINIIGRQNVILRGDPYHMALLRMNKDDYTQPPYRKSEHRNGLNIIGCRNVVVEHLYISQTGGDGVYLGSGRGSVPCTGIHLNHVICDSNYRQGISIINAQNVLVEHCQFRNTRGTPPADGVDLEPNTPQERLVNIVFRNCLTSGNYSCGYAVYIKRLRAASRPVSLVFDHCLSQDDRAYGILVFTENAPSLAADGSIKFTWCTVRRSGHPAVAIVNKPAAKCPIQFIDCSFSHLSPAVNHEPIVLVARPGANEAVGGISFTDCVVESSPERQPMSFTNPAPNRASLAGISGNLTMVRRNQNTPYILTPGVLGAWMPGALRR